ncbi:hypothetical protein [Dokdonia sp. 4H-3-7-5]|uniref:hypothetical protein n=1 Tax=Dokdonia sp. (strain 4H-3-7-5) TaxID=983548 RepID=UPI00020A7378|nr:hypothetical protein [Dokdonia sp. 4H-3-7-5]AEE20860.1 hypothetical protein Krodi_2886 [Dokdonia sp. 4H-3-7-5]
MINYAIENLKEQIFHSKTKEYFEEVIQTFYTDCYRSSVVMLYSVVICDLVFKLEDLRDVYADVVAKKILLEIEKIQIENPKSSDWENKLVDLIGQRTSMLEFSDIENINQLQKHRHLSAHPVLKQTSILFKPSKDNVKSHIRNMLEGVLIKPPILSKKIFNELIVDIAENQYRFSDNKELERFLKAKYFKNLRQESLNDIFKKLWKFVFKTDNDDCKNNREINFRTLEIIISINIIEIIRAIKNEESHYDNILRGEPTEYLIKLLFKFPKIYKSLSDLNQAFVEFEIKNSFDFILLSWFTYDSFSEYILDVTNQYKEASSFIINHNYLKMVEDLAKDYNLKKEFLDLCIVIFSKSKSFDNSDNNFWYGIETYLDDFTNEQLVSIVEAINNNYQIHKRNATSRDSRIIKEILDRKHPTFDYSKYHNF